MAKRNHISSTAPKRAAPAEPATAAHIPPIPNIPGWRLLGGGPLPKDPTPQEKAAQSLENLQYQVLDCRAICSVVASAMESDDRGRLLSLAEQRLQEVSDGIGRIAGELVGVTHVL